MLSKERVPIVNLVFVLRSDSMMNFFKQLFRSLMFPCLHCGSLQCSTLRLCPDCLGTLTRFQAEGLHHYNEAPYPIYSFYEWNPGESDVLSTFFLSLKGERSEGTWQQIAPLFAHQRMTRDLPAQQLRIVVAPSSNGGPDHAYFWGKSIAAHLSAEFVPCLVKSRKRHQRGASRRQRQRLRIEVDEKYSELSKDSTEVLWVFVDDILTTGSTAHAAYEALGSPPHFEVWVLGRRSLSCGASRYLL